ncbi:MAG: acetyltransferase [Lachnospiraceae bacterium]|nr:acetyltransferase [Lachnospiraceae bacterium]
MKERLIILGCGGHARSILDILHGNHMTNEIILVDEHAGENEYIMSHPVLKDYKFEGQELIFPAIGDNGQREVVLNRFMNQQCITIVSCQAYVGENVVLGKGTLIAHRVHLGPEAHIGMGCIINTGSIVEHETEIGDFVHVAPGTTICGRCHIGSRVMLGAGSTVIDKITICSDVTVGAGSVVVHDITQPGTYVGVPARRIK